MQSDSVTRRNAIPLIPPFFLVLLKLAGCAGGGGAPQTGAQTPAETTTTTPVTPPVTPGEPPAPPAAQTQFRFFVWIAGVPNLVTMTNANPTVLEVTQQAAPGISTTAREGLAGVYIWSINGIDGHFSHPGPDWVFEVNGNRIDGNRDAADTVRLNPNDQLKWKLI